MKAVAYLRVSTKDQSDKGYSLPTQLQDIEAYALRNGLEIIEIIQEDMSGQILERPGLTKARELLQSGKAQALIAHDSDRISRSPEHYMLLRSEWEKTGASLHYALRGEVNLDDFSHQLMEDMNGRFARQWLKKLIEATKRGKRGKVAAGKVIVAQRPPYGYRAENNELIICEPEAEIVRLIFALYTVDGFSIRQIAEHLTERQIPTPGDTNPKMSKIRDYGTWSKTLVANILKRETYTGVWHWGKTKREVVKVVNGKKKFKMTPTPPEDWIAVEVPAIIDKATFEAAQKRFAYNSKMASRNTQREYLMSKRLICECGCAMYAEGRHGKGGYVWLYYRCASKALEHTTPNCGAPYFRQKDVDDAVWDWIRRVLEEPKKMIQLLEENQKTQQENQADTITELINIEEMVNKKKSALMRVIRLQAENEDDKQADSFKKVRSQLGQELIDLETKAEQLRGKLAEIPTDEDIAIVAQLAEQFGQVQEYTAIMSLDNVPFHIKRTWVEALNVTGILHTQNKEKKIAISCDLGRFLLSIGTQPPRRYSLNWQVSYTVSLPKRVTR